MKSIVLSHRAEKSLDEIVDYYLTEHSVARAEKVVKSIEQTFAKISKKPESFPVNFDIAQPRDNIRHAIVHHTFKVIFRILPEKIEVLEIFHASRNPELLKHIE